MILQIPDLNSLAAEIHQQNVEAGWWDDFLPDRKHERYGTAMILVISELTEAMEGHRKDLMDDHLPNEKMFDVELADAMIRLLDLVGAFEIDMYIDPEIINLANKNVPEQLYEVIEYSVDELADFTIENFIDGVIAVAKLNNVDLWRLVAEKRAYNRNRADHKRNARAADHGKKY